MKAVFGVVAVLLSFLQIVSGCTISEGWQDLTMEERLFLSDVVVYGKTTQHVANVENVDGKSMFFIDAVFEVFCILKSAATDAIPPEVTIAKVAPRDGCSGTGSSMGIEKEAIVGLAKRSDGKYEYHEMMPTLSASFAPSRTNFFAISQLCGLQQWQAPAGALENRCPICGTSNFTEQSLKDDNTENLAPCIINGIDFSNETDCSLFESLAPSNETVCLPQTYTQTCTQMNVITSSVTCDCSSDNDSNRQGNFVTVNTGGHFVARLTHVVVYAAVAGLVGVSLIGQF